MSAPRPNEPYCNFARHMPNADASIPVADVTASNEHFKQTQSDQQLLLLQAQILDSKEYLAPIIMPHEAVLAFTPGADYSARWPEHFSEVLTHAGKPEQGSGSDGLQEGDPARVLAVRPDLFLASQQNGREVVEVRCGPARPV